MDAKNLSHQMVDFCKTTFDQSFATFMMLTEQMERLSQLFWGQMLSVPEEAKKGLNEWSKAFKKNCDLYKKAVDEGFKNLESLAA